MRRLMLALSLVLMPAFALAQVALVADRVFVRNDKTLVAEGNVEIFQDGTRLRASRITYNEQRNTLKVEGPLSLDDGSGSILVAEQASLDEGLRRGILTSARIVLDQQLQIAANEVALVDDRYRTLTKVVASTCKVCATSQTPLWEIRAERVIHDTDEQQLYFKGAQFRVVGVPLAYLPHLRIPGPEVKRQSGFLIPTLKSSSKPGFGVEVPYFQTLGDNADVKWTPLLTTDTRTLGARYRQGFSTGHVQLDGAITDDDLMPGDLRGYLFAKGAFALPADFNLRFDLKSTSDDDYLDDYGFFSGDRLTSVIEADRVDRYSFTRAGVTHFNSLDVSGTDEDELPETLFELSHDKRIAVAGGEARLSFNYYDLNRPSMADMVGRDTARLGVSASWRGDQQLANGMVLGAEAGVTLDAYSIEQDSSFTNDSPTRVIPYGLVELRWPHTRMDSRGGYQTFEPVMQLVWSDVDGDPVPDETSVMVDFDEGNLFASNRFSGFDMVESGLRANLGATWTRYDEDGWSSALSVGKILRFEDEDQFAEETGLSGDQSDWLVAAAFNMGKKVSFANRAIFDNGFDFTSNEARVDLRSDRAMFSGAYLWMEGEPAEDRPDDMHEVLVDASYRLSRHWTGSVDGRYDFMGERVAELGVGLEYRNECVRVGFSVSNSYDDAASTDVDTSYGVELQLLGIGGGTSDKSYARQCGTF